MSVEHDVDRQEESPKRLVVVKDAVQRRKYDFWPSFYQHSLFAKEVLILPSDMN